MTTRQIVLLYLWDHPNATHRRIQAHVLRNHHVVKMSVNVVLKRLVDDKIIRAKVLDAPAFDGSYRTYTLTRLGKAMVQDGIERDAA